MSDSANGDEFNWLRVIAAEPGGEKSAGLDGAPSDDNDPLPFAAPGGIPILPRYGGNNGASAISGAHGAGAASPLTPSPASSPASSLTTSSPPTPDGALAPADATISDLPTMRVSSAPAPAPAEPSVSDLPTTRMPGTLPPAPQSGGSDLSVSDLPTQRVKATLPPAPERGTKETPAPVAPPATRKRPRVFLIAATAMVALIGVAAALLIPTLRAKITVPAASGVYHQSLINPVSGWPDGGDCRFTPSGYEVGGPSVCFYGAQDVRDANVSVTMTRASGDDDPSAGIAFRRTGPGAFYTFEIDGNGNWAVYKGKSVLQQGESAAILTGVGAQNTLQAQMKGSHFTFSINGIRVAQADDTAYATGNVGLTGFAGLKVVYTNFTIAPL